MRPINGGNRENLPNRREKREKKCLIGVFKMNNQRRKQIQEAIMQIENLVQSILDDEQEAFDNMPEGVQMSYNGTVSEDAQDSLEAAIEALEEAIGCLEEI
jgi:hypothetical protein